MERRYRPHLLTRSPRRRSSTELSVTGRGAWSRLFDELTSAIRVDLAGERRAGPARRRPRRLFDPERERAPRRTAEAVTDRARARAADPRLRLQHPAPGQGDQGPPALLPALAGDPQPLQRGLRRVGPGAGRGGRRTATSLARRWYRTKARLLGIERLADYDRMAVVGADDEEIGWDEGREIVLDTFDSFSPRMREIAGRFMTERWIDVAAARRRSAAAPSAPRPSPRSTPT